MNKFLINEPPLQVLPSLAKEIGLNEAIVLQQLHYWLGHAKVEHDGKMWIYKSYDKWQEQDFPFWSVDTIKRTVSNLKKQNLILVKALSSNSFNRVNHYTVNYEQLANISQKGVGKPSNTDKGKLPQSMVADCTDDKGKLPQSDSSKLPQWRAADCHDVKETNKENKKEINEETTPDVVEDDLVDISFESFYPIAKARLKTSGVIPTFAEYDEDYFKPEIYKFCAWFAKKKLNSNQRLYKLTEWFAKFTVEERKRFYITDEPKHSSYQEFEQEAEPEMTLEEQRRALQAVFGGSNEPA